MKELLPILITLSLAGLVLNVGLNSKHGDLVYVLQRPVLLLKAFIAIDVIPPIAAILLVLALPLEPVVKAGIVLMAISPVPPLVPGQQIGIGARKEYAYGVYVAMALLTIIVVPVVFAIASEIFGRSDRISFAAIGASVLKGVLLPLGISLVIRHFWPDLAIKIAPWIYKLSMLLVVLAFLPIIVTLWPAIVDLVGNGTLLAMSIVILIALAGGHFLGGPEPIDRATLAIASSVRHPGIAMMIASANFNDKRVTAAILLFLLVGFMIAIIYKAWFRHRTSARQLGVA
jgi:BASS family bile acid:Na+ symporter